MEITTEYRRPVLIHSVAMCHVCGWEDAGMAETGYSVAEQAKKHVRKTGHDVTVETGYTQVYHAIKRGDHDATEEVK